MAAQNYVVVEVGKQVIISRKPMTAPGKIAGYAV
jgi:hypothetical protein